MFNPEKAQAPKQEDSENTETMERNENTTISQEEIKKTQESLTSTVEKAEKIQGDIEQEQDPAKQKEKIQKFGKALKKIETIAKVGVSLGAIYLTGQELDLIGAFSASEDIRDYASGAEKMKTQLKTVGTLVATAGSGLATYFGSSKAIEAFKKKESGEEA